MSSFKALTASLARASLRDPATLLFFFIFPPTLLVVLANAARCCPGADGHGIVNSIGPNVMGFGVALIGMFAGMTNMAGWREKDAIRILRCAPMSVPAIRASALTVALLFSVILSVIIMMVGVVPVVGMSLTPWAPLVMVPVFLGTLVFYSLGVLVGAVAPTAPAGFPVMVGVTTTMSIASGAVVPVEVLPQWVQALSGFTPMTYLLEGLRWPLTGVNSPDEALTGWAVTAAVGLVFFWATSGLMRWR
ncbi:ABC transporter permease [Actinomyces israelii]|uniref:ABC transporter permease n=1 Tax=Actinomyces israelii TaxID=1659 RepID=UPI0023561B59|nr:ABC transporter permease [Actinomyces israelii]